MNFTVGIIAAVGILVAISLVMIAIDPGYLSGIPVKPAGEPIACTKEYVPVCGVDGITYGNKCMLDAAKINLDYSGECVTIKPLQEGWKQMKSVQDPGVGHESHQIAMLLPLGDTVYSGTLQYDATEPVQLITLRGPLGPEDKPSATWTPDGTTLYALNLVDPGNSTGTWEFTGNALAVHTRNTAQFTVNYFITETNATEQEIPHAGTPVAPVTFTVSIPEGVSSPGCEVTKECYLPYSIEVRVHDTVIWSNDDTAAHTVTSGSATEGVDGAFDSGLFMADGTFSYTFDEAGTYPYFCMVHPWMTGEVVVKEINDMIFNGPVVVGPSVSEDEANEKVKTMVSNAITLYDQIGEESFESFNSGPEFHDGNLYVFVFRDSDSIMVSHGANKDMIGNPVNEILDVNGDSIGKMIHEKATQEGVWVEYLWEDPLDKKIYPKKSWVIIHDGYIFGSGSYVDVEPIVPTEPVPAPVNATIPAPVNATVPEPVNATVPEPVNATVPEPVNATVPEPVNATVPEPVNATVPESVVTPEVEEKRAAPVEVKMAQGSGVPGCEESQECYIPYKAEIYSGEPIVWNNLDSAAHTVTSGIPGTPDGTFDSGMIMSGQIWQFVFTDPGEYDYYCMIHPWMTGKVIVS